MCSKIPNKYLYVSTIIDNIDDGSGDVETHNFLHWQSDDDSYYAPPNQITKMVQKVVILGIIYTRCVPQ